MKNNTIKLEEKCLSLMMTKQIKKDGSHDYQHVLRVLDNVKKIQHYEGGNLKILIPGAIFHDIVMISKDHPKADLAPEKSAEVARRFLKKECSDIISLDEINEVGKIINECSFSKNLAKSSLESQILQDADALESCGAIAIMRSFNSGGLMGRPLLNRDDPFCDKRLPEPKKYTLDLIFARLLIVKSRMHSSTALAMCEERHQFVKEFVKQLRNEIC